MTTKAAAAGRFTFPGTDLTVNRMGFGAMQLPGKGVFGPPEDRDEALAVLTTAIENGVDHIDTADFYGPHVSNDLIREALSPYPDDLVIVSKFGAFRGDDASWIMASAPDDLIRAAEDNCRSLGVEAVDVVNLRVGGPEGPNDEPLGEKLDTMIALRERGLIRHIGISTVTEKQLDEALARTEIVCVQNHYNLAHRTDDAMIDRLADLGIAYVPYFPLGGFSPLQSDALEAAANEMGVSKMQLALAWLLARSPNILLIPGTSSVAHLKDNLAAAEITIPDGVMDRLDAIGN